MIQLPPRYVAAAVQATPVFLDGDDLHHAKAYSRSPAPAWFDQMIHRDRRSPDLSIGVPFVAHPLGFCQDWASVLAYPGDDLAGLIDADLSIG